MKPRRSTLRFVIKPKVMLSGARNLLAARLSRFFQTADDRALFWLAYLTLLPLYLLPLFVTRFLPGLDLPLHLSLVDAVAKASLPGTPQHALYEAHVAPSGYFAYYALLYLLGKLSSLQLAHRLIISVMIAALPLACARLLQSLGTARFPSLLAFPLAYNMPLHYGFVSFACSIPILVFFVAQVIVILRAERAIPKDIVLLALWGLFLYLGHVQTYGLALLIVLAFIGVPGPGLTRRLAVLVAIVPSLTALYSWQSRGIFSADLTPGAAQVASKGLGYTMRAFWHARSAELSGPWQLLFDPAKRLFLFQVHLLRGFMDVSDQLMSNVFLIALLVLVVVPSIVGSTHHPALEGSQPSRLLRLVPLLVALGAYLALPHHIAEFQTIYPRFAILSAVLSFGLIPPALRTVSRVWLRRLVALSVIPSLLYALLLTLQFHRYGRELADFATVLDATPPGGKAVGLVFGGGSSRVLSSGAQLANLPAYYPIERRSPSSLVAVTFCGAPGSLCRKKPDAVRIPSFNSFHPEQAPIAEVVAYFDYFITYAAPPASRLFGSHAKELTPLARAGQWTVYRKKSPR